MLAPFILFVAKFSKKLNKEPKEDFNILSGLNKIKPDIRNLGVVDVPLEMLALLQ